jgi:hypothetical protein
MRAQADLSRHWHRLTTPSPFVQELDRESGRNAESLSQTHRQSTPSSVSPFHRTLAPFGGGGGEDPYSLPLVHVQESSPVTARRHPTSSCHHHRHHRLSEHWCRATIFASCVVPHEPWLSLVLQEAAKVTADHRNPILTGRPPHATFLRFPVDILLE